MSKRVLTAAALSTVAAASFSWVYNPSNGHWYDRFEDPGITWAEAEAAAETMGGTLATITSSDEMDFMTTHWDTGSEGWIGGDQPIGELDPAANWNWVTGEAWGYAPWSGGEPNDSYGPGSEQHLGLWSGGFNDEGELAFIAGYYVELVPEPAGFAVLGVGAFALLRRKRH